MSSNYKRFKDQMNEQHDMKDKQLADREESVARLHDAMEKLRSDKMKKKLELFRGSRDQLSTRDTNVS